MAVTVVLLPSRGRRMELKSSSVRHLGDFQTPPELAKRILACLGAGGEVWPRMLEPNCGRGNFIRESLTLAVPPREIVGIEIQQSHLESAYELVATVPATRLRFERANVFQMHFGRDITWTEQGSLLVVGNPPWVTSAELGSLGGENLPRKNNIRKLRGIDALTGESNFDIAESIWLKLINELAEQRPTIALLCKSSVARNVVRFAHKFGLSINNASLRLIDAKAWFGVSVDACLLRLDVGGETTSYDIAVFGGLEAEKPIRISGIANGELVPDLRLYELSASADGKCPLIWRQGIKHDAAGVMEIRTTPSGLRNVSGEAVDVEEQYVYPLLKGTDLFTTDCTSPQLRVIVTQRQLGEETSKLQVAAPNLWKYLTSNQEVFRRRKSTIYKNQPPFAMFGIGAYSFSDYKVAVSGFHKAIRFRSIGPFEGKPVLLDDTCYLLACSSMRQAALLAALLNTPECTSFLDSIVFWDAKRPVKKSVLQRVNLGAILDMMGRDDLLARADRELETMVHGSSESGSWPGSLEEVLFSSDFGRGNSTLQHSFEGLW
jgi:hypothetical protein